MSAKEIESKLHSAVTYLKLPSDGYLRLTTTVDMTWFKDGDSPDPPVPPEPPVPPTPTGLRVIRGTIENPVWSLINCPEEGYIITCYAADEYNNMYTAEYTANQYNSQNNTWYWEGELIVTNLSDSEDVRKVVADSSGNARGDIRVFDTHSVQKKRDSYRVSLLSVS